jgi:hypothetical protein
MEREEQEITMKKKICFLSIFGLIVLIAFLVWMLLAMILKNTFNPKIPDYNYRLSLIAKENKGKMIPVDILSAGDWDKVCFLGPYSIGPNSENTAKWNIRDYTNVLDADGHNVLVFSKDNKVVDFIIQNRAHGDFSALNGSCLNRGKQIEIR